MPSLEGDTTGLPATTRTGIPYEIETFSYREAWVPGANRTVVNCRVPWSSSFDWITDMVGRSYVASVYGTNRLRRDLPENNPYDPNQWCTRVEQLDQGGSSSADATSGWPVSSWARYRCTFESMPMGLFTDAQVDALAGSYERELLRYVSRSQKSYAKEQKIPAGAFKIVDDVTPANRLPLHQTGFKTVVMADLTYVWCRIPVASTPTTWTSLLGKTNSVTFDSWDATNNPQGYSIVPGSALYVGYDDSNRYWDANESLVCDVVFTIRYKSGGWNYYLNNRGQFVEVSLDGTSSGTKPYTSADLHALFTVY